MTAPDPRRLHALDRPACTPSAIRAVLAANADAAVLRRYDAELDMAYEQARDDGDLTSLVETVRRWWLAQALLTAFMDAVVIVDPIDYQRSSRRAFRSARTLAHTAFRSPSRRPDWPQQPGGVPS